ncbi:LOW QUALITY PROTEIN: TBC1 domain family member 21 [Pluvialis apricaria]
MHHAESGTLKRGAQPVAVGRCGMAMGRVEEASTAWSGEWEEEEEEEEEEVVDKKQPEKILLLSYVCNAEAGEQWQGFCEMLLLFHLLVEREHEVYWLFQFFLHKTEHSCVMNVGVGKSFIMLKISVAFMDPTFAKHLEGKGLQVVRSLVPWFCFSVQVFKSFDDVWRLWKVCGNLVDLDAEELISAAGAAHQLLVENVDKVLATLMDFFILAKH